MVTVVTKDEKRYVVDAGFCVLFLHTQIVFRDGITKQLIYFPFEFVKRIE